MKQLKFMVLVCMFSPVLAYAQKAFGTVKYTGKVQNMVLHFTLANGYLGGCEIKATDGKIHKTISFLPENGYADENKNLVFYRRNRASKTDHFVIGGMEELFETPPAKIKGIYNINGKAYAFILRR